MVPALFCAALALAAATRTVAQANLQPPVPASGQIGALHFPITCVILGSLNQTFDVLFSGTAPSYGGTGEEFYFTDVAGSITVPAAVNALAGQLGATKGQASFVVNVNVSNASPDTIVAYQAILPLNITAGDTPLRFPPGNDTLPPIGPFSLGVPDVISRISLGEVTTVITLTNDDGDSVSGPIDINCGVQNIEYILGSVSVTNETGDAPFTAANGYIPEFPPIAEESEYGFFRFPYPCNFGPLGEETLDLIIGGAIPAYFSPGEPFYLTESEGFLTVPDSLVQLAKTAFPNVTYFDNEVTDFDILFSNCNPTAFNVASTPLVSKVDVSGNVSSVVIPLPRTGNLVVGPVYANANGDLVSVAVGNATATTKLEDSDGNVLLMLPVQCAPLAPLELIEIAVTDQKPDNYSLGMNLNSMSTTSSTTLFPTPTSSPST